MKRVEVFVEGPSDADGLRGLLAPLVLEKRRQGIKITFIPSRKGDGKVYLIRSVPEDAAKALPLDPDVTMVVVPDLYPKDKPDPHETPQELEGLVIGNFKKALAANGHRYSNDFESRFKFFCLKYEFEVLLLAAKPQLGARLGIKDFKETWRRPVEDQNHEHPPKQVVQALFRKHKKVSYVETADAPAILAGADYRAIAQACPQCFQPLVAFLESCGAAA